MIKNFIRGQFVIIVKQKYTGYLFNRNLFFSKIIFSFSFKVDSITLDPDPNWAKILDPDPNSKYLDPKHCLPVKRFRR